MTRPVPVAPGAAALTWTGRAGIDESGPPVPDGRYAIRALGPQGEDLHAVPASVVVDRTPPRLRVQLPEVAIPPSKAPIEARASDRYPGVELRAVVRGPGGALLALTPWTTSAPSPAGPARVVVEARDAAGNITVAPPVVVPASPLPGPLRVVRYVRTRKPLVALTFDDGLDPGAIQSMLATLAAKGASATFCFNGVNASRWSASVREAMRTAAENGRLEICSHGYSHRTHADTSEATGEADLRRNVDFDRIAGVSSLPLYRPPYGAYGPGLEAAAHALGYRYLLLWSIDPQDWRGLSAGDVTRIVVGQARPGAIAIMHARAATAAALPAIVDGLRAKGLEPVTVSELLAAGLPAH